MLRQMVRDDVNVSRHRLKIGPDDHVYNDSATIGLAKRRLIHHENAVGVFPKLQLEDKAP